MWFYQHITLSLLFLLPFFPVQLHPWITYIIVFYAFLLLPLGARNLKKSFLGNDLVAWAFILFLFASFLSAAFSLHKTRSFTQLALFLAYFIIFTSVKAVFGTLRKKETLAVVVVGVAFILSQISLYNTLLHRYVSRAGEGVSFMWVYHGHNHLSSLLLFAIPLAFYFVHIYWNVLTYRISSLFVAATFLFTLFLTFARASLVALLIAICSSSLVFRLLPKQKRILFLAVPVLFTSVLFGLSATRAKDLGVWKSPITRFKTFIYWQQAVDNFVGNPLVGSGLDTFREVNLASERREEKGVIFSYYVHNFFLQMLSDAGAAGFITSIALVFSLLLRAGKKVKEKLPNKEGFLLLALWTGLWASTVNSLFDFDWQLPTVFLIFWMIAGLF